jgi:hypothetical protein
MKRKAMELIVLVLLHMSAIQGAEVDLKAVPYQKDELRIQAFEQYLRQSRHFRPQKHSELDRNLKEDWLLANRFIKEGMSPEEKAWITNALNRELARMEIERIQRSVKISDDVPKSYYMDHLEGYKLRPILSFDIYIFKSLDKAEEFYQYTKKHTKKEADEYAKKEKVKIIPYKAAENKTLPLLRRIMKDRRRTGYFSPPVFLNNEFSVVYVADIEQRKGYLPYEKVKPRIMETLFKQTYLEERKRVVDEESKKP